MTMTNTRPGSTREVIGAGLTGTARTCTDDYVDDFRRGHPPRWLIQSIRYGDHTLHPGVDVMHMDSRRAELIQAPAQVLPTPDECTANRAHLPSLSRRLARRSVVGSHGVHQDGHQLLDCSCQLFQLSRALFECGRLLVDV
jgi:hypothetical protein